ncbi:MAG: DUF4332 domain-containing protein, partial [Planctomycetota bacterium]
MDVASCLESDVNMNGMLLSLLHAAHCRSTHHHIALAALPLIETAAGRCLASQLLRHHPRYLTGAKDPDTRFRDFQNHVIHVDDGYWGGAPRVAHQWFERLQLYLRQRRYSDAAHASGVLSHYFTDPIMPLHTAQSPVEQVLHRPIEWSITNCCRDLLRRWHNSSRETIFELSEKEGWLGEAILHAARVAHGHYDYLLKTYDLAAGEKHPPAGLVADLPDRMADLLGLAVTGWARVLERIAWQAQADGNPIPATSTSVGMILATIRVPDRCWLRRLEHGRERNAVEALVSEFRETGQLHQHCPSEQKVLSRVREIRHREQDYRARRELAAKLNREQQRTKAGTEAEPQSDPVLLPMPTSHQPIGSEGLWEASDEPRLRVIDTLEAAPSIGPKTAARFAAIGISTVGEFLAADMNQMVRSLATRWMTQKTLTAWRYQAL